MVRKAFNLILLCVLTLVTTVSWAEDAPTDLRFRFAGSSIFAVPTGYARSTASYINDDGESSLFITQALGEILEVSLQRRLSGDYKNENTINGKLVLLCEGRIIPGMTFGVTDVGKKLGDRIYYLAASKNLEDFGLTLTAGVYRDPVDKDKITFFGVEKVILPLISVAAERVDDVNTYGIKITPYPGLSLDVAQRDGKEEMYNLVYTTRY